MAQLIRLSATSGMNLDQVVYWADEEDDGWGSSVPTVHVTLVAPSSDVAGAPMPCVVRLQGEERDTFLSIMHMFTPYDATGVVAHD